MNKKFMYGVIGLAVIFMFFVVMIGVSYIHYNNTEVRLRNQIGAVQENNKNEFDLMWKKISNIVEVTKSERESVERIIIEHASQRNSGKTLINAVKESIPTQNIDSTTFQNLQNIIVASRDTFALNQKKLIDLQRAHKNITETFPGKIFLSGVEPVDINIVTSSKTDEAFETGKDDNVELGM